MKRLFKYKYPKLTLLVLLVVVAYFIFTNSSIQILIQQGINQYIWAFIGGLLFSFGFTTPFAIGIFLNLHQVNPFLVAAIGGLGAMLSDNVIFALIRFSFMDEFQRLERTHPAKLLEKEIKVHFHKKVRNYLLFVFAGIVIASQLPDELGVMMLAGLTSIKQKIFSVISFLFNSFGILVMLLIGRVM